jgi:hypothetical protein
MLNTPRPTPTCTRFQTTTEMPCIKCGEPMKLLLIEPQDGNLNLLTYRCGGCASDESFLKGHLGAQACHVSPVDFHKVRILPITKCKSPPAISRQGSAERLTDGGW